MAERLLLLGGSPSTLAAGLPIILPNWHNPAFIGPLMLGTLLQVGVFCILMMQGVVFFARQGHGLDDGRLFQLYVAGVLLFTVLEVVFGLWRLYNVCVLMLPWARLPHLWSELVLHSAVAASVHGFFIFRCYKLSRSKYVLGLILVVQLAQVVAGILVADSAANATRVEELRATMVTVCSTTVALDTVISATLFINLWRQRTGQGQVDAVILRIMRITVESIVPCLMCVLFLLISVANLGTAPLGSLFPAALPLASPLYANALLATLNSRTELKRRLKGDHGNSRLSAHADIQLSNLPRSQRTTFMNVRKSIDPI